MDRDNKRREYKPAAKRDGKPFVKNGEKRFGNKEGGYRQSGDKTSVKSALANKSYGDKKAVGGGFAKPLNAQKNAARRREESSAKPSDARLIALKALNDVYFMNAYSNLALDKQLKSANLSPEDRRLTTSIFYACVENRRKIDFMLEPFIKQEPEQIILCILHVAAAQIMFLDRVPGFAAVNEAVKQTKLYKREEASGFVNVVLRNLIRAKEAGEINLPSREDDVKKFLEIEYSASGETVDILTDAFGLEEAEEILKYKPKERFETLRPNLIKSSDQELEAWLTDQELKFEKGIVPHAYNVSGGGNLTQTEAYRRGLYSVQGESAMLAAMALKPRRGMNALDACAAPGGKAALICELMQGSGRVYAWDLHEHRAELMKQNGKRLGLDNLRCAARDATVFKDDMALSCDAVLIDAPCTGLGVLSDKPDIKYHLTKARLSEITGVQKKLLNTCCEYVKKGGRLVYSTCTILPEENENQIKEFLLSHPDFKLDEDTSYLPDELKPLCKDGMLTLKQHRDGLEGFFIAALIRVI